ncbi:MAG TPA: hypothetical protein VNK04_07645 [Gemmataceae bacterium]|jgi:hypothetical protein|nr:hypothetical protein [Gemmataceae bacterium]
MNRTTWFWRVACAAGVAASLCLVGPSQTDAKDKDRGKGKGKEAAKAAKPNDPKSFPPGWYSNYDQALAKAKATGQPLLVLFH